MTALALVKEKALVFGDLLEFLVAAFRAGYGRSFGHFMSGQ